MLKLKPETILASFCLLFAYTNAQTNLVPNPSFEQYTVCPTGNDNILNCTNWLNFGNSPDYYDGCAVAGGMSVPYTSVGFHYAHTGIGMVGIITWANVSDDSSFFNYREFVGAQLTNTLTVGTKYYFSFFTSYSGYLHGWKEVASNKIGLRFSTVPSDSSHHCSINNFANLYTDSIYKDTVNWLKLSGSFTADSAYKYVAVGNFFDDAHTDTLSFGGAPFGGEGPYYFIDDVCISTDSVYNTNWTTGINQLKNKSQDLNIYPNPANDILTINASDNIEQVQLVNSIGQVIYSENTQGISFYTIPISSYANGIYMVRITTKNGLSVSKINIVH